MLKQSEPQPGWSTKLNQSHPCSLYYLVVLFFRLRSSSMRHHLELGLIILTILGGKLTGS